MYCCYMEFYSYMYSIVSYTLQLKYILSQKQLLYYNDIKLKDGITANPLVILYSMLT